MCSSDLFESLPFVIPADQMYYQDVVRSYFGGFNGMDGSVPSFIEAGKKISYDFSFEIPDNVLIPSNSEICVLLIDDKNEVVNGMKAEITTGSTGITNNIENNSERVEIGRYSIEGLSVEKPSKGIVVIKYSDGSAKKIMF